MNIIFEKLFHTLTALQFVETCLSVPHLSIGITGAFFTRLRKVSSY